MLLFPISDNMPTFPRVFVLKNYCNVSEISNLEYFYDSINIVAHGHAHFTITHTFDGDDTIFLVTGTD